MADALDEARALSSETERSEALADVVRLRLRSNPDAAAEIAGEIPLGHVSSPCLVAVGWTFVSQGEWERAFDVFRSVPSETWRAKALARFALACERANNWGLARQAVWAVPWAAEGGPPGVLIRLAIRLVRVGDELRGLQLAEEALREDVHGTTYRHRYTR